MARWEFDIKEVERIEMDNNGDYNIYQYSKEEPIVVKGSCTIMLKNGNIVVKGSCTIMSSNGKILIL